MNTTPTGEKKNGVGGVEMVSIPPPLIVHDLQFAGQIMHYFISLPYLGSFLCVSLVSPYNAALESEDESSSEEESSEESSSDDDDEHDAVIKAAEAKMRERGAIVEIKEDDDDELPWQVRDRERDCRPQYALSLFDHATTAVTPPTTATHQRTNTCHPPTLSLTHSR